MNYLEHFLLCEYLTMIYVMSGPGFYELLMPMPVLKVAAVFWVLSQQMQLLV